MQRTVPIGYSTNVHPGRTLAETIEQIDRTAPAVRERLVERGVLAAHDALELGLWLSAVSARHLLDAPGGVERFAEHLARRHLRVRSINGFPYGHFHAERVKHAVYRPSWADGARLHYTEDLAQILAACIRFEGGAARSGSISTVPIGWRPEIETGGNGAALGVAAAHLEQLVRALARLEERTGVHIHVDLEPEPGCFLDRAADVATLFERTLRPRASDPDMRRYLGVCHDVCHAAVMWESQAAVLDTYRQAGVSVGRIQLSSALEATGIEESRALARFVEPRYLHQTTCRAPDGSLLFFEDLPQALAAWAPPSSVDLPPSIAPGSTDRRAPSTHGDMIMRSHFHVPLAAERADGVGTTRAAVEELMAAWPADVPWPAVEVETYTWPLLPESMRRTSLSDGIADEIAWARHAMDAATQHGVRTERQSPQGPRGIVP